MLPEVGVPELLIIGVIALIVVGPKDLPILMRKIGRFLSHMRGMAAEFRASFDDLARESELEELRREVEAMRNAAHKPGEAMMQSIGLNEVGAGIEEAHAEIQSRLAMDPHETPQMHVGPLGEQIVEPPESEDPKPAEESKPSDEPAAEARH